MYLIVCWHSIYNGMSFVFLYLVENTRECACVGSYISMLMYILCPGKLILTICAVESSKSKCATKTDKLFMHELSQQRHNMQLVLYVQHHAKYSLDTNTIFQLIAITASLNVKQFKCHITNHSNMPCSVMCTVYSVTNNTYLS